MFLTFFVGRPVFAAVISIVITLLGAVCYIFLPIARFPLIAPPVVLVSSTYPGADAEEVAKGVAAPLEQEINGAQGMLYQQSTSTNFGDTTIQVTFQIGYDLNAGAAEVLTRVNRATPLLPAGAQQQGVQIRKAAREILAVIALYGKGYDQLFLSNYAETQVIKPLRQVKGVGRVLNGTQKRYAMRVWLDPVKMEGLAIDPSAVLAAVRAQNHQITAGSLGRPPHEGSPALQLQLIPRGRLRTVKEFSDIVVRGNPDGSVVRIRDIGRVELGAEQYGVRSFYSGHPSATLEIYQSPGANAVALMSRVRQQMKTLSKRFPAGLHYEIASDRTKFVDASINDVLTTLVIAILLVVGVTYLFLQSWRATIIPCVAIPVSLIGNFAIQALLGFTVNTLTLLGLVLAVGLVVDDAIVVVENCERQIEESHPPREAARRALEEVATAVVATTLVLLSLFIPVAFLPGIEGRLFKQIALTIAASVALSGIVSLTLTPSLCALLLRPKSEEKTGAKHAWLRRAGGWLRKPLDWFNAVLKSATERLARTVGRLSRRVWVVVLAFAGIAAVTILLFAERPAAFVPQEDQGFFFVTVTLPEGASVDRTTKVLRRISQRLLREDAVLSTVTLAGTNAVSAVEASYYGSVISTLKPWGKRKTTAKQLMGKLRQAFSQDPDAIIHVVNPPTIPGLGSRGGLTLEIEDRSGGSGLDLRSVVENFVRQARKLPQIGDAFTTTTPGVPQIHFDIDRAKAQQLGVNLQSLFDGIGLYLGSSFVNVFNRFGRVYQVYVQGDASTRRTLADVRRLTVPNTHGEPVLVGSLAHFRPVSGQTAALHYNTYPEIEVFLTTSAASTGSAIKAVEKLAAQQLPRDVVTEWTGVAYEQTKGGSGIIFFGLAIMLAFLVLAAQFESWLVPLVVVITTPLAIFGALLALTLFSLPLDIYAQIGLLTLVGLAAKNSILLVAFAQERRGEGVGRVKAAQEAARLRLRPILMTSIAFILGSAPLAIATGAGANARISIGVTVIGGMLVATLLTLFVTPVFFAGVEGLRKHRPAEAEAEAEPGDGAEAAR